jgi:hypothetical protein
MRERERERERVLYIITAYKISTTGQAVISDVEMSGTNQREIVLFLCETRVCECPRNYQ